MNNTPPPRLFSDLLRLRSNIIFSIEQYFHTHNYIAVHTPALSSWLIPEQHIDVYSVNTHNNNTQYLVPSPEIYLKTLLAYLGSDSTTEIPNIYELSHSFRNSEVSDAIHNNEFIMLEWYAAQKNLYDSIAICNAILKHGVQVLPDHIPMWAQYIHAPYIISMQEAFRQYANLDLVQLILCETATEAMQYARVNMDIDTTTYTWEDIFHYILVDTIEPKLPKDKPVYLVHYPARVETLAATTSDGLWSERWELYIDGIELANCYVEETNAAKIASYMKSQTIHINTHNSIRAKDVPYNIEYLQKKQLPNYSGVALGVDRLVLLLLSPLLAHHGINIPSLATVSSLAFFQNNT